ncbi:hypothetical protein Hanom_Chr10g00903191 [Helianthus anomalus]
MKIRDFPCSIYIRSSFHWKRFKKQETLEKIDSSGTVTGSRSKAGAKSGDVKHICMNLLAVKTQLYESELLLKHSCMNLNDKTHLYESVCC